jgi:alkyl hydroperoxide reductase subunit AhpC
LRQEDEAFEELAIAVLVVTFETARVARAYVEETRLGWSLLVDESRSLYEAYGMRRGRWWDIWAPATWRAYARALRQGHLPRRPSGDVRQLGGDVLIDPEGIVRLHHVGRGPADRPSTESLLRVVRNAG